MIILFSIGFNIIENKNVVKDLVIIEIEEVLDTDIKDWVKEKETNKGLHLRVAENASSVKLWILFNEHSGSNNYITTKVKATMKNGNLKIELTDELAADDIYVTDKLLANMVLDSRPKDINVYHNGERENVKVE